MRRAELERGVRARAASEISIQFSFLVPILGIVTTFVASDIYAQHTETGHTPSDIFDTRG
jgi:hypothetical protein